MKEMKAIPNEDYPIPENLSLDVSLLYLLIHLIIYICHLGC